jgi:hypothetical protein
MSAQVIVIDLFSVVPDITKQGRNVTGTPVPGLLDYVRTEQAKGSTVFFIAGAAHDPFWRQNIEYLLERLGIRAVFVTHGLPDGMSIFISTKAFPFHGIFPDT